MPLLHPGRVDLTHNIGVVKTAGPQSHTFCSEVSKQRAASLVDRGHAAQVEMDRFALGDRLDTGGFDRLEAIAG